MTARKRRAPRQAVCVAVLHSAVTIAEAALPGNLASALMLKKIRTLLVDLKASADERQSLGSTHREMLLALAELSYAHTESSYGSYDVLTASRELSSDIRDMPPFQRPQHWLKVALDAYRADYDCIVIDCPAAAPVAVLNGLSAARTVILPFLCAYSSIGGLSDRVHQIRSVKLSTNPGLRLAGILRLQNAKDDPLSEELIADLEANFGTKLFGTMLSPDNGSSRLVNYSQDAMLSDSERQNAHDYLAVVDELIKRA